jgi:hypothetical protein
MKCLVRTHDQIIYRIIYRNYKEHHENVYRFHFWSKFYATPQWQAIIDEHKQVPFELRHTLLIPQMARRERLIADKNAWKHLKR